jgi:NAD+ synthase (glutamine-hydrolysing)
MKIGLGQFNASVGDIGGNVKKMQKFYGEAVKADVDVLVFPEMAVCGYPPEDLLLKKHFLYDNKLAVEKLAKTCPKITIIVGFAEINTNGYFNSLAVLAEGEIKKIYHKCVLPNYSVFDERRYFRPGNSSAVINLDGMATVFTICEDIWHLEWMDKSLSEVPRKDIIINISASPFYVGKIKQRQTILARCAKHFGCAVVYCNLVGGQDELVFDGRSMFLDSSGRVVAQAKAFAEDLLVADIEPVSRKKTKLISVKTSAKYAAPATDTITEVYEALMLGTRDYVLKNGFKKVVIGLSGGIDSSLTAAIAVDALGAENVVGITMPSRFNSPQTINDAQKVAVRLGMEFHTIPIAEPLEAMDKTLSAMQGWQNNGIAYENLQARIRGNILMSLSNQFSYLVLTTGNKSETAVGYSTLYGDTAGGFAVIKDVPKTVIYKLARYVNRVHRQQIIPASVIKRPPTAELRENQKDSDTLPEYELLDKILKGYIEEDKSIQTLIEEGLPPDIVRKVVGMVDRNEYKRRQSPPGVKITPKAFGKDRRMPITNLYSPQKCTFDD